MIDSHITRKYRWFWPWQDEKEELWLREMAKQGLHLVELKYLGQYFFRSGEPSDTVYRLDYQKSPKKEKDAYLQLFKDSGWEHVGSRAGWQYFRKPFSPGEPEEIFTDTASKVEKYQRQIGGLIIFIPIYMMLMMNIDFSPNSFLGELAKFLGFILIVSFLIVILKLASRIDRLRKQNLKQ